MNFNVILPATSVPSYRPLFLWIFHQIATYISHVPLMCYIPCLSSPFWLYHFIWVCRKVQVSKSNGELFLSYFYPPPSLSSLLTFHTFISFPALSVKSSELIRCVSFGHMPPSPLVYQGVSMTWHTHMLLYSELVTVTSSKS
jgi:hypothetical protein